MLRFIGLLGFSVLLSGCVVDKAALSPEERVDQEQRMRDFLNDSSPRNMNQQSKATPEFTKQFRLPGSRKQDVDDSAKTPQVEGVERLEPARD